MNQLTLEAARRGSRDAQATLLRQLQDRWFRWCLAMTGNAEDARDAAQETALRFLRELPKFRGDSALATWSMGIAVNVIREMRRRKRPTEDLDDASPTAASRRTCGSPADEAAGAELRDLLRSSLHDLPERQREALILRYFEDLSVDDTAAAMNCATGTVKATVHQALRTLRKRLAKLT